MYFAESAEYLFASEALKRGWLPLWPSTEAVPFDMQILKNGVCVTIQVKTCKRPSRGAYRVGVGRSPTKGNKARRYKKGDVDFVAVFLIEDAAWYILPLTATLRETRLKPHDLDNCKYKKYFEAWDLLEKA